VDKELSTSSSHTYLHTGPSTLSSRLNTCTYLQCHDSTNNKNQIGQNVILTSWGTPLSVKIHHGITYIDTNVLKLNSIEASYCTAYSNFRVLISLSLCNSIHNLNSHFKDLYLFVLFILYTSCFSLNGTHQVHKTVNENYWSAVFCILSVQ
jgi:hypothetical protein